MLLIPEDDSNIPTLDQGIKILRSFLKINSISIDNFVFKLHYKATFIMLAAFSAVIIAKQYIGDPIDCIVDTIPQETMDTYCWIYSTFTIPNKLGKTVGKDVAHPGVASHNEEEDDVKYHQYYQWVCMVLLIQAILFYVPHYLWKSLEGGRIKSLSLDIKEPIISKEVKNARKTAFIHYFTKQMGTHDLYFWNFFFCEILNLINVVGQVFFIDKFLNGEFLTYGHDVLQYDKGDRSDDPLARVFPMVTKCTFHKYGPSGGVQKFDGLCVLPVNILNQKIYLIIWFWFAILTCVSGVVIIYRIFLILCPWVRNFSLPFSFRNTYKSELNDVLANGKIGDWFIMLQLRKNIDSLIFKEFIIGLSKESVRTVY